jgi:hypothetical protein
VAGGWRRLHNEELRNLLDSPGIRVIKEEESEVGGICSTHGRDEKCIRNFSRKA